jgi:hypothetical protein
MGLPNRSAIRSTDTSVEGLDLRLTALLGDSRVRVSRSGTETPLAGEVDRIDNGTIQQPRLAIFDPALIPGLTAAADAVTAKAADFYRLPDDFEQNQAGTRPAVSTGSA